MTNPDLLALLARVEGARKPSRKLDAELEIVARKVEAYRVLPDPKHHAVWKPMRGLNGAVESQGTRYAAQGFTASLDSAVALCTRLLPGWELELGNEHRGDGEHWYVEIGDPLKGWKGEARTAPLALLQALILALIASNQAEQENVDVG